MTATLKVLQDIRIERLAQDDVFGEQNHPDGTGPDEPLVSPRPGEVRYLTRAREAMSAAREACQDADDDGTVTWRHIMLEEVFEALAEADPRRLRRELVQVAAVAAAWAEAIDRREGTPTMRVYPSGSTIHPSEIPEENTDRMAAAREAVLAHGAARGESHLVIEPAEAAGNE